MRVVHESDGERTVLATDVETADTFRSKLQGLMFRSSIPDDYAMVFRFDDSAKRFIHMLFVPFPTDVVWVVDGTVTQRKTLSPWRGFGRAPADDLFEFPAGVADDVESGDELFLEE